MEHKVVSIPVGKLWQKDVVLMSMRRDDVASTFMRRHFYAMCPLGIIAYFVISS